MQIVLATTARQRGGSWRHIEDLGVELRRRGHEVTVALLPAAIRRQYGFLPLPPAPLRKALVAGGAEYVKRAVVPFVPERLRLVPVARVA